MPMAPLATVDDLALRGVDITVPSITFLLDGASAAVRDAAGCPISEVTSTVTVPVPDSQWLRLPGPVTAVTDVTNTAGAVTGWTLIGGELWLRRGWRAACIPGNVTVTYTHGLTEVPPDIVDLTCRLVASAVRDLTGGTYGSAAGLQSRTRAVDDYRETDTYETGASAVMGTFEIPRPTREWLRSRFGGGVYTSGVR